MSLRVRCAFDDAALGDEIATLLRESGDALVLDNDEDTADVVITDQSGLDATLATDATNADRAHARAPVVALVDPDERALTSALRRGAHAALPSNATAAQIVAASRAAAAGLITRPRPRASDVLESTALRQLRSTPSGTPTERATLTPRERDVLRLLAEGLGNKVLAQRLGIAPDTVKAHVSSILAKLGARTRTEAVAIGAREGLIVF